MALLQPTSGPVLERPPLLYREHFYREHFYRELRCTVRPSFGKTAASVGYSGAISAERHLWLTFRSASVARQLAAREGPARPLPGGRRVGRWIRKHAGFLLWERSAHELRVPPGARRPSVSAAGRKGSVKQRIRRIGKTDGCAKRGAGWKAGFGLRR